MLHASSTAAQAGWRHPPGSQSPMPQLFGERRGFSPWIWRTETLQKLELSCKPFKGFWQKEGGKAVP